MALSVTLVHINALFIDTYGILSPPCSKNFNEERESRELLASLRFAIVGNDQMETLRDRDRSSDRSMYNSLSEALEAEDIDRNEYVGNPSNGGLDEGRSCGESILKKLNEPRKNGRTERSGYADKDMEKTSYCDFEERCSSSGVVSPSLHETLHGEEIASDEVTGRDGGNPRDTDFDERRSCGDSVCAGDELRLAGEGGGGEGKGDGPPEDDVCPICFGDFTVPCKSVCGHWFCGNCILQFWNYCDTSMPCKCPMCSRRMDKLAPLDSLLHRQEEEIVKVLADVQRYNCLFVGGLHGMFLKAFQIPFYLKRYFLGMMDPDRPHPTLSEIRLIAMLLGLFYMALPFDFIPTGRFGALRVFDYTAVLLVVVLRLVGIFRRRRLVQRVRLLGDPQLFNI